MTLEGGGGLSKPLKLCPDHRVIISMVQTFIYSLYRIVSPNIGHPVLTLSFTKYRFLQVKNSFATSANGQSVLKLFQPSYGIIFFYFRSLPTASTKCVNLE